MLNAITQWTVHVLDNPNQSKPNLEHWTVWEEWQKQQPTSHFQDSSVFHYYASRRPGLLVPQESLINHTDYDSYVYCFGNFSILLAKTSGSKNAIAYFTLLLDLYDVCKGISRRITGDPTGISALRSAVTTHTLDPIQLIDFSEYEYPYHLLHAHTIAEFSLSTLIMRLISHYMNYTGLWGNNFSILNPELCHQSETTNIFKITTISCSNCKSIIKNQPLKSETNDPLCPLCFVTKM
jgi:hypothetical protein